MAVTTNHVLPMRSPIFFALLSSLVVIYSAFPVQSFGIVPHKSHTSRTRLCSENDNNNPPSLPRSSRLEGNQRPPTEDELALMDEMIDKLAEAKPYELPQAVRRAFRVISSPQFFLRIAERTTPENEEKFQALASNLVSTLEMVVETTEEQLDERAKDVEKVVKAAAEPGTGEFLVPLVPARIEAMREELQKLDEGTLDEGFLSTLDAWMNKSHQDGMDLMVGILQKVLQMYAGIQITRTLQRQPEQEGDKESYETMLELFSTDADKWDMKLKGRSNEKVLKQVQKSMETVVFSLDAGSMAQRVQAEYLQELAKRIEANM